MKLERIKELQEAVELLCRPRDEGGATYCTAGTVRGASTGDGLLSTELRFLLDTAAQAGKTCAWVPSDDGMKYATSCGLVCHWDAAVTSVVARPCYCGGRVIIRDGRAM